MEERAHATGVFNENDKNLLNVLRARCRLGSRLDDDGLFLLLFFFSLVRSMTATRVYGTNA